ncbi:hypothetical protein XI08_25900 [Bradyrhizobium sp. CCBAU 11361]|nr:hypothetical protein [Bradyrhizobium sp. CCBAU 11361]
MREKGSRDDRVRATAVALDHTDHMVGSRQIGRFIAQAVHRMFSNIDIAFRAPPRARPAMAWVERMSALT